MRTAVDTSVLLAIAKTEPDADAWIRLLAQERESGELLVCDIVAARYYASILDEEKFTRTLRRAGFRVTRRAKRWRR